MAYNEVRRLDKVNEGKVISVKKSTVIVLGYILLGVFIGGLSILGTRFLEQIFDIYIPSWINIGIVLGIFFFFDRDGNKDCEGNCN